MHYPRSVVLHLTENCNLNCKMCYFWGENGSFTKQEKSRPPETLDFNIIKDIVEYLIPGKPFYSLFGGEPLLYPHLEDLISLVKGAGSFIDTPTNGTLLKAKTPLLVRAGFDLVRVSLDGPKKINDQQRGKGTYEKAIEGIEALAREKHRVQAKKPKVDIIYTVTNKNYNSIESLFLEELDLNLIDMTTIQMQNYLTEEMGARYSEFLEKEFDIDSNQYWKGLVQNTKDFNNIDTEELARQVKTVSSHFKKLKKQVLLLPPTFTPENLNAYLNAEWNKMTDLYKKCIVPWVSLDITASGKVAPCHIFYDLTMGNLHENTLEEIWNSEKYKRFRTYMEENSFMPICSGCCILYLSGRKQRKRT